MGAPDCPACDALRGLDPFLQAQRSRWQCDVALSSTRYQLVSRLFDLVVTGSLAELQAATRAIHAADRALRSRGSRGSRQGAALLASARKVAYTPVLPAVEAGGRQWLATANAPADAQWERLQAIWSETARNNYRRARQLAEQAQAAP